MGAYDNKTAVTEVYEAAPPPPSRASFVTLRAVISAFCALIVLVVAAITFSITYTSSLTTVRDVGALYAASLATTGRIQIENYFDTVTAHTDATSEIMKAQGEGWVLPREDPLTWDVLERAMLALTTLSLTFGTEYIFSTVIFTDGSMASYYRPTPNHIGYSMTNAVAITNASLRCCSLLRQRDFHYPSMAIAPMYLPVPPDDKRFDSFDSIVATLNTFPRGIWNTISIDASSGLYIGPVRTVSNSSGYNIGVASFGVKIATIGYFLRNISVTPNAHMFALDDTGFLAASTHPAERVELTPTTNRNARLARGCASTSATAGPTDTNFTIACRQSAANFPYAPLNAIAGDRSLMRPRGLVVEQRALGDDGRFYIAAVRLENAMALFGWNLVVLMPEKDILGDIVARRNIVIAIVCCVFIVAVAVSFALVFTVLQPLATVSRRMRRTAKLQESAPETNVSSLAEIQDLQIAYNDMNTAIRSFTRYVPRDVVKDLLASGQLCEIKMTTHKCSMLFIDIAGFTTLCERVPAAELSELVRIYFEQMSSIVMRHGGLIDKYIGDCIMAVWGAPFEILHQEIKATLCGVLMHRETRVDPCVKAFDEAGEVLRVRVGVATGEVLAGNMGSAERMNYTVIGDPVNLAARLESMNKQFGTGVMVPEETAEGLRDLFVLRLLSKIAVVGKDVPVKVYEVTGLIPTINAEIMADLKAEEAAYADDNRSDIGSEISASKDSDNKSNKKAASLNSARAANVSKLLSDAQLLQPLPPVSNEAMKASCVAFTEAVHFYQKASFADARDRFEALQKDELAPQVATGKLLSMCEEQLRNPSADFDGVFRADEK